ncbi:transcriptional regulator [Actinoplanes sp. M2I2]|uniref:transcriptional regulator n=1 Tax=Actinoplanes sp. M2I2 TaxID=1734444 RepID=UPI002022759A|nr:transcriptional regulator [Actinoplanes sp. M2I2]
MHPARLRKEALALHAAGVPFSDIWRRLGLSRNTVASWLYSRRQLTTKIDNRCPRCDRPVRAIDDPDSYAYLLGQYLGDGHLLMTQRVPLLTIACDLRYPGLIHEVSYAVEACGAKTAGFQERAGCVSVRAHWAHWPCLIPQHGPGAKHLRVIALSNWQHEVIDGHPERFLRGLFHSDGSRFTNRVVRNGRSYSYPRYNFVNESVDIMGLCARHLDRLEIAWRMARPNVLSVARREAVARLDEFVGPKW